jgi:hypothetical protein
MAFALYRTVAEREAVARELREAKQPSCVVLRNTTSQHAGMEE